MEEEKGVVGSSSRAAIPCGAGGGSSFESKGMQQRQRFHVDLKPGETTIVSWKKLIKDSNRAIRASPAIEPPSGAHPALESRIAPGGPVEGDMNDALPPPNRFSAVIQKIESLYMGENSSDEEDLDILDDDQYDTDDSFIDDAELDEYFQVDKSVIKHNGFFVNRGKLERINEPISSPIHAPKKRRRKDLTKAPGEKEVEHVPKKLVKMGAVRMKTAARNAPLVGNKFSSPSQNLARLSSDDHFQEGKVGNSSGPSKPDAAGSTIKPVPSSEKSPSKDSFAFPVEAKDFEKQKSEAILPKELGKVRVKDEHLDSMHQAFPSKGIPIQVEHVSRKQSNHTNEMGSSTKVRHKEKSGKSSGFPDLNFSGSKSPIQKVQKSPSMVAKEGAGIRPKGTMLERAIRELETRVAESRPPTVEVQEVDASSQAVKRRLPQDVKQKLAKVARLAQASQGKISEELINHLMTFLGHLLQVKTLKRNLKEMVELGLSAKQQKADRFQQIKREVTEMIRMQGPFNPGEREYKTDEAMEDRLCDLYDLYVEGMDEDKGPQMRKLYVELAELWPNGSMDSRGIKYAVRRAKERRRGLLRKDKEKLKRKKLSPVTRTEEGSRGGGSGGIDLNAARALQERSVSETNTQVAPSSDRLVIPTANNQSHATHHRTSDHSTINGASLHRPKQDKVKGIASSSPNERNKSDLEYMKKAKRKKEMGMGDTIPVYPRKLPCLPQGKETHKFNKQAANPSMIPQHKASPPVASETIFEQPS